jgi:probable F420-dependent oxidoreductase
MTTVFQSPAELASAVGKPLGKSDWLTITQDRIDRFAEATGDHQWIHVDPTRAAQGPFGRTIAHGYLTQSLVNYFLPQIVEVRGISMGINYGADRVRFPAPDPRHRGDRGQRASRLRDRHDQPLLPGREEAVMKFWQVLSFTDPEQLVALARTAEEAGFHGVLLSDHLFYPEKLRSRYPYSPDGKPGFDAATVFPDVWTSIAAMATATTRLHFSTLVFVLPLRQPLEVAKTLGTLSLLTGGRVALGCGAGWIREEFDQLGVDFATRGRRFDEMIAVLRAIWRGGMVEHHGEFFDFDRLQISPAPRAPLPIWVGGVSAPALRRAARLGDGWLGTGHDPAEVPALLGRLRELRAQAGRASEPFETIVPLLTPPDVDVLRRLSEAGMTSATAWPFSYTLPPDATLAQKQDALLRYGESVIARMR